MEPIRYIPPQFDAVRDDDEIFFWTGKPAFVPFILTGVGYALMSWIPMLVFYVIVSQSGSRFPPIFFLFFALPVLMGLANIVRMILVYNNTQYAVTNKRIMMRGGFLGIDFRSIDFDKISDIEVTVNPLEYLFSAGTITGFSGRDAIRDRSVNPYASYFTSVFDRFLAIPNPYAVFKQIKKLAVDAKTDWNYPNALRPDENPGYHTTYQPKQKP